jgi:hypothetical protein
VTLLLSFYSSYGIVFAADSAITITDQGKTTRYGGAADPAQNKQEKLLELKPVGLNGAVLGFFGLAAVGEKRMDTWLREIFGPGWHGAASAAEVGDYLRDQLTVAVPKEQRESNPSRLPHRGIRAAGRSRYPRHAVREQYPVPQAVRRLCKV